MLQDFELAEAPIPGAQEHDRPHVCIVGAGAAGIALATELASHGLRVLLLEGGGLDLEARSQELYRAEIAGLPYRGAMQGRFRTYGGSTTQWGGQILELDDADFAARAQIPGSGWPFPKSELAPFYERALRFEGLRLAERQDARVWAGLHLSILDLGPEFRMLYSRWCPERDFGVLQGGFLRDSRALRVLYHANVTGLELNEAKSAIRSVRVRGYSGREVLIEADRFVFCLGGIETTRLLLQPLKEGIAPWQQKGLLGKHTLDHIALNRIPIREIATQPAARYFGYAPLDGFQYHNKIQLSATEQAKAGTLNVAGTIGPWQREDPARDAALARLRAVWKGTGIAAADWVTAARYLPGNAWRRLNERLLPEDVRLLRNPWRRTMLTVHCEQSPDSASSLSLGDQRDALGMLRVKLDWTISALELHTLRTYVRRATEIFSARRFARVIPPKGFFEDDALVRSLCLDSYHHMGGVRMAVDAGSGVVDPQLKLHALDNAYVCSSAVFPTGGFGNPTHTLLALAMRLADHLREQAGKEETVLKSQAPPVVAQAIRPVMLPTVPLKSEPPSAAPIPAGTTQLGFGCAYLLGPGLDHDRSLRLLAAAYDAGIRHFDTARLYGQGRCEALLGEFLRSRPDATVATKFGIEPPSYFVRGMTAVGRRAASLQPLARLVRGSGKARFNAAKARRSLERSLRALGRERVDLFLLHEPERLELVDDRLLRFLEDARSAGTIGNFGIGGEHGRVAELYATRRAYTPVLQFEHSIFGPVLALPEAFRIHYRTFARPAAALASRFAADPSLGWWWSEMVGADLQEPRTLARLLLRAALDQSPGALTLFSTATESHVYENASAATDSQLAEPAMRLARLVREDDLGVGEELYRGPGR